MSSVDEEKVWNLIQKKQGVIVPRIAFELNIDEKVVWQAVTSLLKAKKVQTVYLREAFHFYKHPLTQCPYCGKLFATTPEVKEHILDHLFEVSPSPNALHQEENRNANK
ncbi:MAG: hypothetical protein ACFFCQ_00630 [Promethearchaeota archaeon]